MPPVSNPATLDDMDYRIVSLLRKDGRMPFRAIAKDLGLTESTVRGRVRRLEESNTMKVVAVTDFEAVGYNLLVSVGVQVENRSPSDVAADLAEVPEVFSVTVVVGAHDIEILVVAEDEDALCNLLSRKLADLPGVKCLTPSMAMDVLKNQASWVPFYEHANGNGKMTRSYLMDEVDYQILERLSEDARISNRQIASEIGVTEGTVRGRIKRMEDKKRIRITAVTNISCFPKGSLVYIGIEVERSSQAAEIARQLADMPEFGFVGLMMGRFDILAITMVQNNEELTEFVHQRITSIEGVRQTRNSIGVSFIKHDYRMSKIVA